MLDCDVKFFLNQKSLQATVVKLYWQIKAQINLKKIIQIINAGEGVKKRKPSYTVAGNVNWCSHYGKQCGGSSKTKNRVTI